MSNVEWEERPYGRKKTLSPNSQIIQIDPEKHTGMAAKLEDLDEYGLRGHPGVLFEHVEHLGYPGTAGLVNDNSLLYKFRPKNIDDQIRSQFFSSGSKFYSVQTDSDKTGYWHVMKNVSSRPIHLKTTWENE